MASSDDRYQDAQHRSCFMLCTAFCWMLTAWAMVGETVCHPMGVGEWRIRQKRGSWCKSEAGWPIRSKFIGNLYLRCGTTIGYKSNEEEGIDDGYNSIDDNVENCPPSKTVGNGKAVKEMSLTFFRSVLIEHFDAEFRNNNVTWQEATTSSNQHFSLWWTWTLLKNDMIRPVLFLKAFNFIKTNHFSTLLHPTRTFRQKYVVDCWHFRCQSSRLNLWATQKVYH